ncbi:MAG TPA: hypothetical protein ENI95_11980 [Chloroflexi bacterium]|nr:hypothetical protein [Chloroflexota bacterium]
MSDLDDLPREELLKLLDIYAKNWLAHDGAWFLAAEERFGMETAIELDIRSWERFSVSEAKRIMRAFDIPEGGGLEALERALRYRLYARVNEQAARWTEDGALEFRMVECRVQSTRRRKGLPDFPCKPVGLMEYSQFARTIDPRIRTECLACPPDSVGDAYCVWRFTLREDDEGQGGEPGT